MTSLSPGGSMDPQTQLNTYHSYITMLGDRNAKDESKMHAAEELSDNFEV